MKVGSISTKLEQKLGVGVVKPVFVSVDPDRDSLAQLRHYAQDFHPRQVLTLFFGNANRRPSFARAHFRARFELASTMRMGPFSSGSQSSVGRAAYTLHCILSCGKEKAP